MPDVTLTLPDATVAAWTTRGLDIVDYLQTYAIDRARQFAEEELAVARGDIATAYTRAAPGLRRQIETLLAVTPRGGGRG